MEKEVLTRLTGEKLRAWQGLMQSAGLTADEHSEQTVLLWDGDVLAAAGSRQENLLKCLAVSPSYQGAGLTATLMTALRQEAFAAGHEHLFLYTKPRNAHLFAPLFFYPVAKTSDVLLMESKRDGIGTFLRSLPVHEINGDIGALVMHCDPFTHGHRYVIETAARECDHVYVFVLSEDKGFFSAADRMEMVLRGTADLKNVTVLPTGPYLISSATFPTYFIKNRDVAEDIHCLLDIRIFLSHFAPHFGIMRRYAGTEPFSPLTARYNALLKEHLPAGGVEVREISRFEICGRAVSASAVRQYIQAGDVEKAAAFVPETTLQYLRKQGKI